MQEDVAFDDVVALWVVFVAVEGNDDVRSLGVVSAVCCASHGKVVITAVCFELVCVIDCIQAEEPRLVVS